MSAEDSIRILLGRAASGREPLDAAEWKRAKARVAWVRGAIPALEQAQRHMDVLAQSVRGTDEQCDPKPSGGAAGNPGDCRA